LREFNLLKASESNRYTKNQFFFNISLLHDVP